MKTSLANDFAVVRLETKEGPFYYRNISGEEFILYYSFKLIPKTRRRGKLQTLQFYIKSKTINLQRVKSVIIFGESLIPHKAKAKNPKKAVIFTRILTYYNDRPKRPLLPLQCGEVQTEKHSPSLPTLAFSLQEKHRQTKHRVKSSSPSSILIYSDPSNSNRRTDVSYTDQGAKGCTTQENDAQSQ